MLGAKMNGQKTTLIETLQVLRAPDRREFLTMALEATAFSLRVDHVSIWLFDGKRLQFAGDPDLESRMPSGIAPGEGMIGSCFSQGQMSIFDRSFSEPWTSSAVLCEADEPVTGYLVPLKLAGQVIGVLAALVVGYRDIEPTDAAGVEGACLKLVLALHHCAAFPEMCPDWMTVFEEQTGPAVGQHRLDNCPMLIADEVPKGIHGPTLKALCRHLHYLNKRVTCKEIADAVGLSQVTVGRYLTYMIERRLVRRTVLHRQSGGRPTYLYCAEQHCPQLRL